MMDFLRKNYKIVIAILLILIGMEAAVTWYMVNQFRENYLSGPEALEIAAEDAGIAEEESLLNQEIKLKHKDGTAWYEIHFDTEEGPYVYEIDAEDGSVRSSSAPGR